MTDSSDEVTESYYRCRRDSQFLDTFYETFLAMSPRIAEKFSDTDFQLQKLMLRQSLLEMICFERGMAGTSEEIERLGRRHRELDISAEMYSMWLDALCAAVSKHDPDYTPALEQSWRTAMQKTIDLMIAISNA